MPHQPCSIFPWRLSAVRGADHGRERAFRSRQLNETLPLRDAFAVLFFVSVGMLFDPMILLRNPWLLIATVMIILVFRSRSCGAAQIVRAVAGNGGDRDGQSRADRRVLVHSGGAWPAIRLMPKPQTISFLAGRSFDRGGQLIFAIADRIGKKAEVVEVAPQVVPARRAAEVVVVLVGYGRVGSLIGKALDDAGATYSVIEDRGGSVECSIRAVLRCTGQRDFERHDGKGRCRWQT